MAVDPREMAKGHDTGETSACTFCGEKIKLLAAPGGPSAWVDSSYGDACPMISDPPGGVHAPQRNNDGTVISWVENQGMTLVFYTTETGRASTGGRILCVATHKRLYAADELDEAMDRGEKFIGKSWMYLNVHLDLDIKSLGGADLEDIDMFLIRRAAIFRGSIQVGAITYTDVRRAIHKAS